MGNQICSASYCLSAFIAWIFFIMRGSSRGFSSVSEPCQLGEPSWIKIFQSKIQYAPDYHKQTPNSSAASVERSRNLKKKLRKKKLLTGASCCCCCCCWGRLLLGNCQKDVKLLSAQLNCIVVFSTNWGLSFLVLIYLKLFLNTYAWRYN